MVIFHIGSSADYFHDESVIHLVFKMSQTVQNATNHNFLKPKGDAIKQPVLSNTLNPKDTQFTISKKIQKHKILTIEKLKQGSLSVENVLK